MHFNSMQALNRAVNRKGGDAKPKDVIDEHVQQNREQAEGRWTIRHLLRRR